MVVEPFLRWSAPASSPYLTISLGDVFFWGATEHLELQEISKKKYFFDISGSAIPVVFFLMGYGFYYNRLSLANERMAMLFSKLLHTEFSHLSRTPLTPTVPT